MKKSLRLSVFTVDGVFLIYNNCSSLQKAKEYAIIIETNRKLAALLDLYERYPRRRVSRKEGEIRIIHKYDWIEEKWNERKFEKNNIVAIIEIRLR